MAPIDFSDIAHLLNFSRTTKIDIEPVQQGDGGRWSLHRGSHNVHTSSYPFNVLYLKAAATLDDIKNAFRATARVENRHVVFPSSSEKTIRTSPELRLLLPQVKGLWTAREYLVSFIKDEVQTYVTKIRDQAPRDYIDPPMDTPSGFLRQYPNPVLSFMRDPASDFTTGRLGIVLAEPGQGKTYMSRYLVSRITDRDKGLVPLMVDSSQWQALPVEDQRSLAKTIAHSFRHFGATIGWLDGHEEEFLTATLKADLFRIVFDGFDEYILRNRGTVQPMEVLEALADLAAGTGTRIVITSRTSFWDTNLPAAEVDKFLESRGAFTFKILPFDLEHAKKYFAFKLKQEDAKEAEKLYSLLKAKNAAFVGRGFVLSLVADLAAEKATTAREFEVHQPMLWLAHALCERESLRQQLPFTAQDQMGMLRMFAVEVAEGSDPTTELLELCMTWVRPTLDIPNVAASVEKLKSHPLIEREPAHDLWTFKQEQIRVLLLADQLVRWDSKRIQRFVTRARMEPALWQDLGTMIVDMVIKNEREEVSTKRLQEIISSISVPISRAPIGVADDGSKLAGIVALTSIERLLPKGSSRLDRAQRLVYLCGGTAIFDITFVGTIAGYDLRGVVFERCRFERLSWANCKFDESTTFLECHFIGGVPPVHCEAFGTVNAKDCRFDPEAEAVFNSEKIKEGRKKYTVDDLRTDMHSFINRFVIKGGIGLKTVEESILVRGVISASRHRDAIVQVLKSTILQEHKLGNSLTGYNVSPEAVESVKFYAANNVFTGPLREAFEALTEKLGLA